MDNRALYSKVNDVLCMHGIKTINVYEYKPFELLSMIEDKIKEYTEELKYLQRDDVSTRYYDISAAIRELKEAYKNILFYYEPKPIKEVLKNILNNMIIDVKDNKIEDKIIRVQEIDPCINLVDFSFIFYLSGRLRNIKNNRYKIKDFHIDKVTENGIFAKIVVNIKEFL